MRKPFQSTQDYFPFGSLLPGRGVDQAEYKYGFNSKENDNEVYGDANFQDYGMRMYDTRVGRFVSVDPITKSYPMLTPYQFASNTPIWAIDLDGLEAFVVTAGTGRNDENTDGHSIILVAQYEQVGTFNDGSPKFVRTGFKAFSNLGGYLGDAELVGNGNNTIGYKFVSDEKVINVLNNTTTYDAAFSLTQNSLSKKEFRESEIKYEEALNTTIKQIGSEDHSFGYKEGQYNCTEFVADAIKRVYGDKVSSFFGSTDMSKIAGKARHFFNPNQLAIDLRSNSNFKVFNSHYNVSNLDIKNFLRVATKKLEGTNQY